MNLSDFGSLGAVRILREAAERVKESGASEIVPRNPYSGSLSIEGALALACGARVNDVGAWDGDYEFAPTADHMYGLFMEIIVYLESFTDCDIQQWEDRGDTQKCVTLLERAADRIDISVC